MCLGDVHVHLVSIKVCVVRRCDRQVQPEGGVRQDSHAVSHHGHLVQGRLTVEEDQVSIDQVTFNLGGLWLRLEVGDMFVHKGHPQSMEETATNKEPSVPSWDLRLLIR